MLYRGFALPYIMRLKESVFSNLLESPNGNLRNFTKEKIDMVIRIMQELLKRSYALNEQYEIIEKFSLDVSAFLCSRPQDNHGDHEGR